MIVENDVKLFNVEKNHERNFLRRLMFRLMLVDHDWGL